jgi:aldose sugar dehydrogenase
MLVTLVLTTAYSSSVPVRIFQHEVVHKHSGDVIWGFDFLDQEQIIYTRRSGELWIYNLKTKLKNQVQGAPTVWAKGQGGLLDVRTHPTRSKEIYLTYSKPQKSGATTALGRGVLDGGKLQKFEILFEAQAETSEEMHFGSRIEFDKKGHLFMTIGDRYTQKQAQNLNFHAGKIIRLNENGKVPTDNPFVNTPNARPEIWSLGHRNPQGLTYDPETSTLWSAEMGPLGGDELNRIVAGNNYGWPEVTLGREYWGPVIGTTEKKGMENPFISWTPSISPSGITIYRGSQFPLWNGHIAIANLGGKQLRLVKLNPNIDQQVLIDGERFRNVRVGPDGALYYSTDSGQIGRLIKSKK